MRRWPSTGSAGFIEHREIRIAGLGIGAGVEELDSVCLLIPICYHNRPGCTLQTQVIRIPCIEPEFAMKGGFDRPILQGLCTFGFAGRAMLHSV